MTPPFVEIGGGHRLSVRAWGEGPPVLLLGGWGMDHRCWSEAMGRISYAGCRAISYDRRGHGASTDPGVYDWDALADDLAAVIDALGYDRLTLVSHSAATGEIIRYLTRHGSNRVSRAIFVAGIGPRMIAPTANDLGMPREAAEAMLQQLMDDLPGFIKGAEQQFAPQSSPDTLLWLGLMPRDNSFRAVQDVQRQVLETDFTEEARRIDCPVTLIHGDADPITPIEFTAHRYAELISDVELLTYPGAAHGVMVTHAAQTAKDIVARVV